MTWLVTGAAGFIGSNLCLRLVRAGFSVVGVDDLSAGKQANLDRVDAAAEGRFRFVRADVRDGAALRQAAAGAAAVVHLAAQASVPASFADPMRNDQVNGLGFLNVLDAAGAAGARLLVFASSCAVYGDSDRLPLAEDTPVRPLSPYAATKLLNEHYAAMLAGRWPGLATVGLRLFNIFGPWQDAEGGYAAVIPRWLEARLRGEAPVVFGDGSATRDYCHVDNVTAFILGLFERPPPAGPHILNIGTGLRTSLVELDAAIRAALIATGWRGNFPPLEHREPRHGDILHSVGDPHRAVEDFGFRPEVDLQRGLAINLTLEHGLKA